MRRLHFFLVFILLLTACSHEVLISRVDGGKREKFDVRMMSSSSEYLISTSNYLSLHLLTKEFSTSPDSVLMKIAETYELTKDRLYLEVLTNLCYVRGKELEGDSGRSLKYFVSSAYYSYVYLFNMSSSGRPEDKYNPNFFVMTRYYKYSIMHIFDYLSRNELLDSDSYTLPSISPTGFYALSPLNLLPQKLSEYSTLESCANFKVENLFTDAYIFGVGLPLVATRSLEDMPSESHIFETPITPVTLQIEFFAGNKFQLRFYPTLKTRSVEIGESEEKVPLEVDLSTPIAFFMQRTSFFEDIHYMLFPDELVNRQGLYIIGNYDPDKIPVIMVHGLMSNPQTWVQMVNYLLSDKEIASSCQFIYYYYSTGQPVIYSAGMMRRALRELSARHNPAGDNANFNKMVIVGHSMGGLLAKAMIKQGSSEQVSAFLNGSEEIVLSSVSDEQKIFIEDMLLFEPLPFVSRVVFMAVPHRGSEVARWDLARWGSSLIHLPSLLITEIQGLVDVLLISTKLRENSDPVYISTGIDNLDPDNLSLNLLLQLKGRDIPFHSIIGNRKSPGMPEGSDGIVPYWSSHMEGAKSELVVKSGHSVHKETQAIEEVRRILREHVREMRKTE